MTTIRAFHESDIPFALEQTGREGWDATAELFQMALDAEPDGCLIADQDGCRVGLITTLRHRAIGWIGNLIVVPEARRRGIGEALMKRSLERLARLGLRTVRLEADPDGVGLYRRLGFVDEYESPRFLLAARSGPAADVPPLDLTTIHPVDLPLIARYDAARFGDDRTRVLERLYAHCVQAWWIAAGTEVRGYALTWPSTRGIRVGPWVADDPETAALLLRGVIASSGGRAVVVAVPGVNTAAIELLGNHGFARTPSSLRMNLGDPPVAGRPECMYALANGAMG